MRRRTNMRRSSEESGKISKGRRMKSFKPRKRLKGRFKNSNSPKKKKAQ
jgi:hypothetical protein